MNQSDGEHHWQSGRSRGERSVREYLTTAHGLRLPDTDRSLKGGDRGPTLLEDFPLREKVTHFDHERIPERVAHARGVAAHGAFQSCGTAASVTKADFSGRKARRLKYSAASRQSLVHMGPPTQCATPAATLP
jgi:catalase